MGVPITCTCDGGTTLWIYFLGTLLGGIGTTLFGSDYNNRLSGTCSPALITVVFAFSNTVSGFSQSISPIVMDFLAAIFKFEGVGGPWKLAAYVLIPAAIATTIAIIIAASILPAKKRADVAKL